MPDRGEDALARAVAFVRRRRVLRAGESVLVASGGGAASVGLLALLALARDALALGEVMLVAVDTGGVDDSDGAADAARAARALGVSAMVLDSDGLSVGARVMRARNSCGFDRVALGHTVEDGAARVLREVLGEGAVRGLAARRRDGVCRPLLESTAADADAIALRAGLSPPSDRDGPRAESRARALDRAVRDALLPRLRASSPGADLALVRLPRRLSSR